MTQVDALKILEELGNSKNMVNHAKACGFAMSALFDYLNGKNQKPELDKNAWETVGMLHDADYEATDKSLERHTELTTEKLKEVGANQIIINAICGHCDKADRKTLLAKSIYAADELTGLIVACALVQPDRKLSSVAAESVLKKFKNKSFAAGASRDQIKTCEIELDIQLAEFVQIVLKAMQANAKDIGL